MNIYDLRDYGLEFQTTKPQTALIQRVLDLAKETGGRVVFPRGEYVTGGLLFYSHMTLYFEDGAHLLGSTDPSDYPVFPVPLGMELHTDMDMMAEYFIGPNVPRPEYRRALLSAYGAEDIAIIGEGANSVLDGRDCYDPEGEEKMRGPHGIFLTNCKNVLLQDYVIKNSANFHHQMDTDTHVTVRRISVFGGHDGFHLHCSKDISIEECLFYTGDDCIAGINISDLTIRKCTLNTSCQLFRIGGKHIHVEDCRMFGPGVYPYRRSIMTAPGVFGPLQGGHHETNSFMEYFASRTFPADCAEDIVFKNCTIENAGTLLWYRHDADNFDGCHFCTGTPLRSLKFENVKITGNGAPFETTASEEAPLYVVMKNVTVTGKDGKEMKPFAETSVNLIYCEEAADVQPEGPDPEEALDRKMFKYADEAVKEKAANPTLLLAFIVIAVVFVVVGSLIKRFF